MNPETGAGAYKISGGLNGGSVDFTVYLAYLDGIEAEVIMMAMLIEGIAILLTCAWVPGLDLVVAVSVLMLITLFERYVDYIQMCARYLETGDEELGKKIKAQAKTDSINAIFSIILRYSIEYLVDWYISEDAIVDGEIIDGEITGGETGEVIGGETSGGDTGGITGGETSGGETGESHGSIAEESIINNKFNELLNSEYYKTDPGYDCSEIAEDFYMAANKQGKIYRIEGANGKINGYEYGYIVEYDYHEVYSDGKYIYDPRYKNTPVLKDDYFRDLLNINPDGFDVFEIK